MQCIPIVGELCLMVVYERNTGGVCKFSGLGEISYSMVCNSR